MYDFVTYHYESMFFSSHRPEVHEMGTFVTDHYHTTVKMPTYLLAFMFSQFLSKSANTSSGVLVTV